MDNIYFKNTTDVWFVNTADVTWTRGDIELLVPEFISRALLSGQPQIILPPSVFAAYGRLDISDVMLSYIVAPPAFRAYGRLDVDAAIAQILLSPPAFRAYGRLDVDAAIASYLVTPSTFRAYARLDVDAAIAQIIYAPPAFSASAYLRAMAAATFADRGWWITYACVLSGTPELVLPMSSFRADLRADGQSRLTVNVPGDEYYEAVALRVPVEISDAEEEAVAGFIASTNYDPYAPTGRYVWFDYGSFIWNPKGGWQWIEGVSRQALGTPPPSPQKQADLGRLSVYMIKNYFTGEEQGTLLADVDLSEVHYSRDAVTKGIVLSGYKEKTWTPKTARVTGAQNQSIIGGRYRYRCVPGYNINPGDTVVMEDGNSFVAGTISWIVSPGQEIMELAEAELDSYL